MHAKSSRIALDFSGGFQNLFAHPAAWLTNVKEPRGKRLLYAYIAGHANLPKNEYQVLTCISHKGFAL
jgi:hypothetical protein